MSRFPCSYHSGKVLGKMAVGYWAWFNAVGERTAWKMRYCVECAAKNLRFLFVLPQEVSENSDLFVCVLCGGTVQDDSDPVWCTLYVPGQQPREWELQLDAACAVKVRSPITSFGERLPDRAAEVRGPSSLTAAWDALGLAPPA